MQRVPESEPSSTRLLLGALLLLLLVAGYGGGYWLALDHTSISVSASVPTTLEPVYHYPRGVISEHVIASFFAPAHWVDTKVRARHWKELYQ